MNSFRSLVYLPGGANATRVFCRGSGLVQGLLSPGMRTSNRGRHPKTILKAEIRPAGTAAEQLPRRQAVESMEANSPIECQLRYCVGPRATSRAALRHPVLNIQPFVPMKRTREPKLFSLNILAGLGSAQPSACEMLTLPCPPNIGQNCVLDGWTQSSQTEQP